MLDSKLTLNITIINCEKKSFVKNKYRISAPVKLKISNLEFKFNLKSKQVKIDFQK